MYPANRKRDRDSCGPDSRDYGEHRSFEFLESDKNTGQADVGQVEWARKRRSAKWAWVNHQVDYKMEQDILRAQRFAENALRVLGYPKDMRPSFGEVMQIMDRTNTMREFVWDKMDVTYENNPKS